MVFGKHRIIVSLVSIALLATATLAQNNAGGDGSIAQRLEVMRQKLETIRRSATSAASALKQETKDEGKDEGDNKEKLDTPYNRLKAIEKEADRLRNDVNSLRNKV